MNAGRERGWARGCWRCRCRGGNGSGGHGTNRWRWKGRQKVRRVRIGPLAWGGAPFRLSFLFPRCPENHPRAVPRRSPSLSSERAFMENIFPCTVCAPGAPGAPAETRHAPDRLHDTPVLFRDSEFHLTNGHRPYHCPPQEPAIFSRNPAATLLLLQRRWRNILSRREYHDAWLEKLLMMEREWQDRTSRRNSRHFVLVRTRFANCEFAIYVKIEVLQKVFNLII